MSYLVLARKYRSKNFAEMVGQEHVVRALSNALATQRLHHAYLFTGTRGVGKTTVSRILAKSLNCQGPDGSGGITATPCGVCMPCRDIDAGRFVDYTELDAASNRGVDEVQSLLEQAVYKPVQGRFKVFMIDEVHMLTNTAFNAMLKTLEEPPEYLKFVLATTDPQKVPVTVLSRCLQFNLRPMAPQIVRAHLEQVLAAEGIGFDLQALRLIARAARGSMRDALSLTDQAIAFGAGKLDEPTVRQMLGSVDRSHVFRLIDALARGDGKTVVETSETLRLLGLNAASTLEEMSGTLQRMAVLQAVPDRARGGAPASDANADGATHTAANAVGHGPANGLRVPAFDDDDDSDPEAAELHRLAALMPTDETQLLYSMCLHGRAELGLAPDDYAALTMVLLRLLAFKPPGVRLAANAPTEKKTLSAAPNAPAGLSLNSEVKSPAEHIEPAPSAIKNVVSSVQNAIRKEVQSEVQSAVRSDVQSEVQSDVQSEARELGQMDSRGGAKNRELTPSAVQLTATAVTVLETPVRVLAPEPEPAPASAAAQSFATAPYVPDGQRLAVRDGGTQATLQTLAKAVSPNAVRPAQGQVPGYAAPVAPWDDAPQDSAADPNIDLQGDMASIGAPVAITAQRRGESARIATGKAASEQDDSGPEAGTKPSLAATQLLAVPVRIQSAPGARSEPVANATIHLVPTPEGDVWHALVQQLVAQEAIAALVRELALQSQLVARDVGQWMLRVERESLNQPVSRERLQVALRGLGHDVTLVVEVGRVSDSPARRNAVAAAARHLAAEKIIFDDPYVQSLMRDFGAKIVPGSIKPLTPNG